MPIFEKNGEKIAFIHIPKTAGSSIEHFFTGHGWNMAFYKPFTDPHEPSQQHYTYERLKEDVPDLDDIPSFCVVRNPCKRIISEWRWQRSWMKNTLLSFPDFVRRVDMSLVDSKTYWDNHWRPQADFTSPRMDAILKMERLDTEFSEFIENLGLKEPSKLPEVNKTKKNVRGRLATGCDEDTIQRIGRMYSEDFEQFGYSLVKEDLQ